jgi:hypothetical protein
MNLKMISILAVAAMISACASRDSQVPVTTTTTSDTKVVKSMDGSYEGVIVGTINPDSKFSKLKIGMKRPDVHTLIGIPNDAYTYLSGKGFIPFYFGNDARRINEYYEGEGCLVYTGGGGFGIPGGQLIGIYVDKTKNCFK